MVYTLTPLPTELTRQGLTNLWCLLRSYSAARSSIACGPLLIRPLSSPPPAPLLPAPPPPAPLVRKSPGPGIIGGGILGMGGGGRPSGAPYGSNGAGGMPGPSNGEGINPPGGGNRGSNGGGGIECGSYGGIGWPTLANCPGKCDGMSFGGPPII